MHIETSSGTGEEPPAPELPQALKLFHSAGRGFWRDVPESDWNNWQWQLKHRITTLEQLQRLMPTL
ncbi:MAG TPA: lysine 2,3-aminomutase, partial [Bacillota bacterium]|nr:lysine 2,3-aminomutase [Bacillota bacterium]